MISVRPVSSSDAAELAELLNAIIARGGTTALETPYTPEHLDEVYLTGPDVLCCFVAVDEATGRLAGGPTRGRAEHLDADGGESELGMAGINATIRADNEGGLAFYAKQGFVDHSVDRAVPLKDGTPIDRINKRHRLSVERDHARERAFRLERSEC